jgi:hypothetical protein
VEAPAPTLGEIIFTVFDWMTTHKATLASTRDIWEFTRSLFPTGGDADMGLFQDVQTILKRHRVETLETIPVCVNMCIAYWDTTHPRLQAREYQNAHRTKCPRCTAERYLSDGRTERRRIYYLPFKEWMQDIFTKPDLARTMNNDLLVTDFPSGHLRRSEGWRRKVTRICHTYSALCSVILI